jgi:SOS-response transcriptional repressor LexA
MTNDDLWNFIATYSNEIGYPPTMREMADHFDCNDKTIRNRLRAMREEGEVSWMPGEHRTVKVNRRTGKARSIPM